MSPRSVFSIHACLSLTLCLTLAAFVCAPSAEAEEVGSCGGGLRFETPVPAETCAAMKRILAASPTKPEDSGLIRDSKARDLAARLETYLVAEGYYEAKVHALYSDASRRAFVFSIAPHEVYRVERYTALYDSAETLQDLPQPKEVVERLTPSPKASEIVSVQERLLVHLRDHGYPFAVLQERFVKIHREDQTAEVVLRIDPGLRCVYGKVHISGLEKVERSYVDALLTLKPGAACSQAGLAAQKTKLGSTGLFSFADIKLDRQAADGLQVPVQVIVKEGPPRTLRIGLSYETNTGLGSKVSWTHRNLFGRGEKVEAVLKLREISQSVAVDFRKFYPRRNTTFFGGFDFAQDALDAYDATKVSTHLGYDRPFRKNWRLNYALYLHYVEVETEGVVDKGVEVSLPTRLQRSKVDDALSPVSGHRLSFKVEPVRSAVGEGVTFVQSEARGALYHPLDAQQRHSVALWGHVGATFGGTFEDIPSTRLFYGGGLQSVRAIEYERLGTLDANNVPLGGRSILEGGVELRTRVAKNWSVVGFVEAGRSFAAEVPDFKEDLLTGGGIGLRYATPVGPLRLDLATPFDPRPSDADLQFYIGIGQAF